MAKVRALFALLSVFSLLSVTFIGCAPERCTLSTSCSPEGAGSVAPSGGTYYEGIQIDVTATPAIGYRFDHWEGNTGGTANPLVLVIDGDVTVTACFVSV